MDDALTLCEIKYNNKPYRIDKDYAKKIASKMEVYQKRTATTKQLFFIMIVASGLKPSMYSEDLVDGVVVLDDLFI